MFASCVKDEVPHAEVDKMVEVAIVASTDDTRLGSNGNITYWEVGDMLSVALTNTSSVTKYYTFEIESTEDIADDGKHATFRGSVAEGTYSKVTALYPAMESPAATITLNRHAEDNIYMESTASYAAGDYLTINTSSAYIPLQFSHLMHKVDYTLTLASGYSDTDISKDVAIEMLLRSNDSEFTSAQCYNYDTVNGGIGSAVASAPSTLADFTSHNFTITPTASTLVFPAQLDNASLVFNIYVGGRKAHTIVKAPSKSPFTMTAGKSTSVKLELSEENRCEVETTEGGGSASIEGVDTYLTQIIGNGGSSWGNKFTISGPNNISFALHVASDYSSETHIDEGRYEMKSSSFFSNSSKHIVIRSLSNVDGIASNITAPNGGSNGGDTYTIKIVIAHSSSVAAPLGFIGKLNVENGGQAGGDSGESTAVPDITLSTLTSSSASGYYTFYGENSAGDSISFNINSKEASTNSINAGTYELSSCNLEGYFNATSVKIGGVSKAVKSGVLHAANSGGSMVLNADITFSDGTTRHFVFSGAISAPVIEGDITISASQSTITNNGLDYVDFTATQDGNIVTNACTFYANGEALGGPWFSSSVAGTYTIYATNGTKVSNELTITVVEYVPSILTLSASKTTMAADGTDTVTFTVKADSSLNVTSLCDIYVNGSKINGATFKTGSAGTYSVYAMYKGVKSNTVNVTANASERVIVFAEGVTLTSGWYDVNKFKEGNNGDIQMCWAASASNIIQWWQDRYVAHGGTLPSTAINGPSTKTYSTGCKYQLAVMDMFHSEWDNSLGGYVYHAVPWYFEGVNHGANASYCAKPLTSGGYFSSAWNSYAVYNEYTDYGYTSDCGVYYNWGNGTNLTGTERLKKFSDFVVEFIDRGMVSLTVAESATLASNHHAVTLWGYEIDKASGLLTRVWLTDSDDMTTEPKTEILHEYSVSIADGMSNVKLFSSSSRYTNGIYVAGLIPVSGPNSAN